MNTAGAPPPPPPPPIPSVLPSSRLPTEILARAPAMNPPAALAGAMLKDKKPFTYTPGGIDLSEIKSPRMQKRLLRNAQLEGVRPSPLAQQPPQVPGSSSGAASAASQGIAVQVLPVPGMGMGPQPPPQPREPPKPKRNVCGPPPPPPPFVVGSESSFTLPAPAPPQTTITSPPTIASPPTSPPTQAHQPTGDLGASIPAAPPPPSSGSAAWRSIHPSATPSTPSPAKAEQREPSPPPPPPPQTVKVPTSPSTQEPPLSPPVVKTPVVQSPAAPSSPLAQREPPPQPWVDRSTVAASGNSQAAGDKSPQLYHPTSADHLPKERVLSPDNREEQSSFSVDPSPSRQVPAEDQHLPAAESPTKEPATTVQVTPQDSECKEPSPVREASPTEDNDITEPSPVKESSPVKEPSPVEQPSPAEQVASPIMPSPVKDPSASDQDSFRGSSPTSQVSLKDPSSAKQVPIKDSSPPVQSPPREESPVLMKEASPLSQTPAQESLPVEKSPPAEETPAKDSSPARPLPAKDPSPASRASAESLDAKQQLHVSESFPTRQMEPPQPSSPPTSTEAPVSESAPWRRTAAKGTSATSATEQPPQPAVQSPQTIPPPSPSVIPSAPDGETKEQIISPVIQTVAQEPVPRNFPATSVLGREAPWRQTSHPEPPRVTHVPIQQPGTVSQPPIKQQQQQQQLQATPANQMSWQSPTPADPEPAQPVTRHIPVRMASPPPSSSLTSPPASMKGTKLVRQSSLPTKPSSPKVSPPNAQLGSISVPSTSDEESTLSPSSDKSSHVSPSSGLGRTPLPWMCPPKQGPSPPPFIVSPPPNAQQRHLNQLNRIIRQKSTGSESAPSQPFPQATVIPQPEVYQHPGIQKQWSLPPSQQQQQQPQSPRIQQTRTIPIHVQRPNQNQAIPIHIQRQQQHQQQRQQQQYQPRERIIPIMIEQDTPLCDSTQNSLHSFPAQQGTFVPIGIMRQQSEPTYQQTQPTIQPQPAYQSQQSFQPQPTFQPQQSFQPQSAYQSQPTFQPSQPAFQQPQEWQQPQQQQQAQQQHWTNSPGTAFSPPQFPSSPLSGGANGAFLPYNSPADLYSNNSALDALHQMQQSLAQLNSGIQNSPQQNGGEQGDPLGPVQSRSFRVLQNVLSNQDVAGSDDETSNYMRQTKQQSHAPVQQEETQQSSPKQQMQQSYKSVQNQGHPQSAHHKHSQQSDMPHSSRFFRMLQTLTDTLPDGAEPQGPVHIPNIRQQQKPSPQQQPVQYQPPTHYQPTTLYQQPGGVTSSAPSEEAPPEPKKYMGGSIPSRSFKMLQALTSTDDVAGPGQSDL